MRLLNLKVFAGTLAVAAMLWSIAVQSPTDAQAQGAEASRALTVATIERRPFSMKQQSGHAGFSIDLWDAIARDLKLTYKFTDATTFTGMLDAVRSKRADLAIANISITSEREKTLDFSHPIFDAGLQVLVRKDSGSLSIIGAFLTWSMLGWVALAGLMLLVISSLMWYFEHRHQPYFQHNFQDGMWPSFWWALNVIINGGFETNNPRTPQGRVFATLLVVASLFLVSAFVAKITSVLTVSELKSQISGIGDLYGRRVGTTAGSTAARFLASNAIKHEQDTRIEMVFEKLLAGKLDAVVHDAPLLAYFAATAGRGQTRTVGPILRPEKFGIALQQGSVLTEDINRSLLRLHEDGTYQRLYDKWFSTR